MLTGSSILLSIFVESTVSGNHYMSKVDKCFVVLKGSNYTCFFQAKGEPGGPTRNKPSSSSSTRKPSDSKKDPPKDKKKEGEKKESEKKDTSGEKKGNASEEKTGKEQERKRSHSKDPSRSGKDADRRPPRKSIERRLEHRSSSDRNYRHGRDVLSFKQVGL